MLKVCDDCETAYAPDLQKCPHCGAAGFGWNHESATAERPPLKRRKPASG